MPYNDESETTQSSHGRQSAFQLHFLRVQRDGHTVAVCTYSASLHLRIDGAIHMFCYYYYYSYNFFLLPSVVKIPSIETKIKNTTRIIIFFILIFLLFKQKNFFFALGSKDPEG